MTTLNFKDYMLAVDDPNKNYLSCSFLRRTDDWWRFYEIANEMVEKYNLDGSGILLGSKVMMAEQCNTYTNQNRGYKGISGGRTGYFRGPVIDDKWKDYYFGIEDTNLSQMWIYRPCWWRFLIVLPENE